VVANAQTPVALFKYAGHRRHSGKARRFYVQEHNARLPHSVFNGQTPDEMYLGTGMRFPRSWKRPERPLAKPGCWQIVRRLVPTVSQLLDLSLKKSVEAGIVLKDLSPRTAHLPRLVFPIPSPFFCRGDASRTVWSLFIPLFLPHQDQPVAELSTRLVTTLATWNWIFLFFRTKASPTRAKGSTNLRGTYSPVRPDLDQSPGRARGGVVTCPSAVLPSAGLSLRGMP
jgi:hypothetical protein